MENRGVVADPTSAAGPPHTAADLELAHWRRALTILAGLCAASFVLWLVVVFAGPLGPLTGDAATALLSSVVLAWVVVDLVVRSLSRRDMARS
ncbi:MAG TPA: hypothetical protein VEY12_06495 [Thermoplasmata archaeon]|nr:hypothetical protein [Thermoplasmata archaeon]